MSVVEEFFKNTKQFFDVLFLSERKLTMEEKLIFSQILFEFGSSDEIENVNSFGDELRNEIKSRIEIIINNLNNIEDDDEFKRKAKEYKTKCKDNTIMLSSFLRIFNYGPYKGASNNPFNVVKNIFNNFLIPQLSKRGNFLVD